MPGMDGEVLFGYLAALAWLGLIVYLPASDVRRAGSVGAWVRECAKDPLESLSSILIWAGCTAFLLWLITRGAVSIRLALLAPAGFTILLAKRRAK